MNTGGKTHAKNWLGGPLRYGSKRRLHLVDLVGELARLLVVDCVRVKQSAEGFKIGLFLQERDEVVSVAGESGGNYFTDLPLNVVGLRDTMRSELAIKQTGHEGQKMFGGFPKFTLCVSFFF